MRLKPKIAQSYPRVYVCRAVGSRPGKRRGWHLGWPPNVFLSERESPLLSPFHIPKRSTLKYCTSHWWTGISEPWPLEVAETTPGKFQILCFSFFFFFPRICKGRFPSSWGWHLFWVDLGGLVSVIMSAKSLECLGKKFQVSLLLLLVFQFPWTLRTH